MSSDSLKDQIEAAYEQDERPVEAGTEQAGQMTVAFCGGHYTNLE
ncbi:hypothetical protein [Halorussus salinus]|nr:hypothetical protein [Halorussus salinus]